jgi:hypothetical protein
MKIPSTNTFLRPQVEKEMVPREMEGLLRAILDEGDEEVDVHLRTVNRVFDVQKWYDDLLARDRHNNPPPAFSDLTARAAERLDESLYLTTETYLGVRLGYRTETLLNPVKDGLSSIKKWVTRAAAGEELSVGDAEKAHWVKAAGAALARARHVIPGISSTDAETLIWLMRKPFYLTYGCPEIDIPDDEFFDAGSVTEFATGELKVTPRYVEVSNSNPVSGAVDTFYTATVCISEFSRKMYWPETAGWADIVRDTLPNAEWSIRATVLPPTAVKKQIKDNLGSIQEEISDAAQSGHDGGRRLQEQAMEAAELEYQATNARMPWIQITYRIQLRAGSPEQLEDLFNNLKTQLRAANLTLHRPPHDQLDLLMESVPGGAWKRNLYSRRQSLSMLGGGGLLSSYQVGDEGVLGPYLGRVVVGDAPPVFFDTSRAMGLNQGPVVGVSGAPGFGKTFLSLTLAYQCAARGYKTIYIDPKRDAVNLGLIEDMGRVNLLDLADPGNDGILDPFRLSDGVESSGLLAMEVLKTLVGNLTEERETVLATAIDHIKESDNPSMWALTEYLSSGTPGTADYNLGSLLKTMRQAPFGRLMFSPNVNPAKISATDGLTVITLLGIDTPPSNLPPEDYTYDQRIGVAIMYLLTKYAYQLMESGDKNSPKALFIDEAWSVLATRSGRDLVNRWGRMGRSHNAALVLVTQSVRDFSESGIANQISTRFAFGTKDPDEYGAILEFMGVSPDQSSMGIIQQLSSASLVGHCLMKDPLGRIGVVNIDPYRNDLREAFDTNPETRKTKENPAS